MPAIHIENSKQISDLIKNTKGKVVVVDFWAGWCGPCVGFAPTFERMSGEFQDCVFAKVEVDECPEAADEAQIQSIPSFHIYLNGQKQEVIVGAAETRVRDAIKKAQSKL